MLAVGISFLSQLEARYRNFGLDCIRIDFFQLLDLTNIG